jgi:hypothetical protein
MAWSSEQTPNPVAVAGTAETDSALSWWENEGPISPYEEVWEAPINVLEGAADLAAPQTRFDPS